MVYDKSEIFVNPVVSLTIVVHTCSLDDGDDDVDDDKTK